MQNNPNNSTGEWMSEWVVALPQITSYLLPQNSKAVS